MATPRGSNAGPNLRRHGMARYVSMGQERRTEWACWPVVQFFGACASLQIFQSGCGQGVSQSAGRSEWQKWAGG